VAQVASSSLPAAAEDAAAGETEASTRRGDLGRGTHSKEVVRLQSVSRGLGRQAAECERKLSMRCRPVALLRLVTLTECEPHLELLGRVALLASLAR
jgi:hypothetical protein